ncbi:hypothetical protein ACJ2A9_12705 [Anaerobacillus sp. MEB173]|uniref:hypothetical protein n=1 Tax=Anaerobacillus sp. MEB173 TaxID=3383345 RepID=UPI003F8FD362
MIPFEYVVESLFLSFVILHQYFKQNTKEPNLVIVTENSPPLRNDGEKILYHQLTKRGYFVSSQVRFGGQSVDLALMPYKIAIIIEDKTSAKSEWLLNLYGWKVLSFTEKQIKQDLYEVIRRINTNIKKGTARHL